MRYNTVNKADWGHDSGIRVENIVFEENIDRIIHVIPAVVMAKKFHHDKSRL